MLQLTLFGAVWAFSLRALANVDGQLRGSATKAVDKSNTIPKPEEASDAKFKDGNYTGTLASFANQQVCVDTPDWNNGWEKCHEEGMGSDPLKCVPHQGWTCAAYAAKGWCQNNQCSPPSKTNGVYACGHKLNSPEWNCCACGKPQLPLRVASYNTLFMNFPCCGGNSETMKRLGDNIVTVAPAILGTQENQDGKLLEGSTKGLLKLVPNTSAATNGNAMYYDPGKVSFEGVSGSFAIPRDNHAPRHICFAKYKLAGSIFWHFNTHMPHKHNEAGEPNTHAKIAGMLLEKRRSLGAENAPTVITGDFNSFASDGDPQGSFESNVVTCGFTKSCQATGNTGGHEGLDKVFHSATHWMASPEAKKGDDGPTGGSDHALIHVELALLTDSTPAATPPRCTRRPTAEPTSQPTAPTSAPTRGEKCAEACECWFQVADGHTCGERIEWAQSNIFGKGDRADAANYVYDEHPDICMCEGAEAVPTTAAEGPLDPPRNPGSSTTPMSTTAVR